jgi:ribonuclease HI
MNGWKTALRSPWKTRTCGARARRVKEHESTFVKVKGHSDNTFNNRCDELARLAIKQKHANHTNGVSFG